jgi:hypothetical protein
VKAAKDCGGQIDDFVPYAILTESSLKREIAA